jgi:hypothetical protein
MGQHRDVATVDSVGACTHPLRQESFQFRLHRPVVVRDDVPTRLRLPGDPRRIPAEEIGSRGIMGRPNNLLFFLREVSRKARDAFRTHPDAPVCNFDVLEHVGYGELRLLALRSFVRVGGKCGDVDESNYAVIERFFGTLPEQFGNTSFEVYDRLRP